ncbi:glycosyltransferase, partial [Patescibacteria group bacterium]|nr:glycosyltransferase [Patescibacteria group bacterium]
MNKPVISIVILNYNSIDYLRDCIRSIEQSKLKGLTVETIVVDNASTDESVSVLRKDYKDIRLIASKQNNGFAAGNNLAVDGIKSKYILFLNPDTVLGKNVLKEIYRYMEENSEVGAATCRLELFDGTLDYSSHRGFPTPLNAFFYFSVIWWAVLIGLVLGGIIDRFVPKEYISIVMAKKSRRTIVNAVLLGFLGSACCHGRLAAEDAG